MRHRRRPPSCSQTADLLAWQPVKPVRAFEPVAVRAASLGAQISKAIGLALKGCGKDRAAVAAEMSDYLGEAVSPAVLDKYSSESAESHIVNVVRFIGLIHATRDRRLLQLIADHFGWAVVEQKHLAAIELASLLEQKGELDKAIAARRQELQATGALR